MCGGEPRVSATVLPRLTEPLLILCLMVAEGQLGIHDMDVVILRQGTGKQGALIVARSIGGYETKAVGCEIVIIELFPLSSSLKPSSMLFCPLRVRIY